MKFIALILIALFLQACSEPAPKDSELIGIFKGNRDTFSQLQEMICSNGFKVVSMDPEWSDPENISVVVKRRYYDLFREIGVKQLRSYDGCRTTFSVWSVGFSGDGDYKNYQFRPKDIDNVVSSLDSLSLNNTDYVTYHRELEDNWFISYIHWP